MIENSSPGSRRPRPAPGRSQDRAAERAQPIPPALLGFPVTVAAAHAGRFATLVVVPPEHVACLRLVQLFEQHLHRQAHERAVWILLRGALCQQLLDRLPRARR